MAEERVGPWARASGVSLGLIVLAQLAIGSYLNIGYAGTPEGAADAMAGYRDSGGGRFLQNAHYWGSAWLIVHGFFHVFALLVSGAYLRISKWAWLGSAVLFGAAFAMQVTGNLLPFDRHDVQTAVIEGNIFAGMPLLGTFASTLMMNGKEFGPDTLRAWHQIHLWLIVPMALSGLVCLLAFPPGATKPKGLARYFWFIPLLAVAGLSLALTAPFGPAATGVDFFGTDASPSWYAWPMHGALNAFESLSPGLGWIGAAVLPGLLAAVILLAPWLGAKRDRLVRGLFLTMTLAIIVLGAAFGGTPAAAWGFQDVPSGPGAAIEDATPIDAALAAEGLRLARENCAGCHGKELTGGRGFPNLTIQFRRHSDSAFFRRFIRDPRGTKPGSRMPGFSHLSEGKIAALAEWLRQKKP